MLSLERLRYWYVSLSSLSLNASSRARSSVRRSARSTNQPRLHGKPKHRMLDPTAKRDELLSADRIGHRRSLDRPHWSRNATRASRRARRRQQGLRWDLHRTEDRRLSPARRHFSCLRSIRFADFPKQSFPFRYRSLSGISSRPPPAAGLRSHAWRGKLHDALLVGHDVIETRHRAERRRIPVRRIFRAANLAFGQTLWTPVRSNTARPG